MADNVPDEGLAAAVLRAGLLPPERLDFARDIQRQALEAGLPITLGEVLVQKHLLTAAQREQLEQQVRAQPQGGVRRLGNYQFVRKLGGGAKGVVYLAQDSMLGRQVALRVLPSALAADLGYVARFKQEGIAAAKVSHLHVATTFAVGHDAGYRYHVAEFCEGETLDKKLARQKLFAEEETLSLAVQVASGLEAAHGAGLVHRELRPANILVTRDGTVKVLDFGQAKPSETTMDLNAAYYASPEQARGDTEFDACADIYSFGAILYHLLTGQPPFTGPSDVMVMTKHLAEPLPDPREVRPGLSEGLAYVLRRCLAKDAKDRYPNAAELCEDLERVRDGEEPAALARKRPQPITRLRGTVGERPRLGRRGTNAQEPRYRHGLEDTRRPRRPVAPAGAGTESGRERPVEPDEAARVPHAPAPTVATPPRPATPPHRPPSSALPATRTPIPVPSPPKTPLPPAPDIAEHIPEPAAPRREGSASSRQRALESGRRRALGSGEHERASTPRTPDPAAAAPPSAPEPGSPARVKTPVSEPPSAALPAAPVPTPAPAPPSAVQPAAEAPAQTAVPSAPQPMAAAQGPLAAPTAEVEAGTAVASASAPAEGVPSATAAATEAAPPAGAATPPAEASGSAPPSPAPAVATAAATAPTPAVEAPPRKRRRRLVAFLIFLLLLAGGGLGWLLLAGPLKPQERMGAPFAPLAYWAVIGPLPAKDGADLDVVNLPDTARDLKGTFAGKSGPLKWKLIQLRANACSFGRELGLFSQCTGYGVTWLDCPEETKAVLGIGSDDGCRVFLNGQKVHETRAQRGCTVDNDMAPVVLKRGLNELFIKIAQGSGEWGFAATIRGADGKPIPGLKGCLPAEIAPPPPEPPKKPAAPPQKPATPQKSPATKK
jgi:serine/threonine-protein kinase